jgi:hypothetical protein
MTLVSDSIDNSQHSALSFLGFLLPGRISAAQSLLDTPPHLDIELERPSTALGFREDNPHEAESTCDKLVSEAWAGIPQDDNDDLDTVLIPPIVSPTPRVPVKLIQSFPLQTLRYHGHSKSALIDYKLFWNARYDEWARIQTEIEEMELLAYDGIQTTSLPSPSRTRSSSHPAEHRDTRRRYNGEYIPDTRAPIYPRTGDLASLRRPASLNRELLLVGFPLHKIRKILFAHDMDYRFELAIQKRAEEQEHEASYEWEGDSFASDEDTLVEEPSLCFGNLKSTQEADLKYQAAGAWEVDWDFKWELLIALIRGPQKAYQEHGDLSEVCRVYLDGEVADMDVDGLDSDDEDNLIIYDGFEELLIC